MKIFDKVIKIFSALLIIALLISGIAVVYYAVIGAWDCYYRAIAFAILLKLSWMHDDIVNIAPDDDEDSDDEL